MERAAASRSTSDGTSTIEIGGQNVGTAGSITIDSGVSFTESGTFSAPVIADNGTITVAPNTSLTIYGNSSSRGLTGTGTMNIDKGSSLTLNGVDPGTSDTVTIDFAQTGGQLWLASDDFDALGNFKPAITGFGATDVIEYQGTATSATYASGYLSLYNGANLVAKFNIGSGYAGDTFSTVAISGGYTQVDLAGTPNAAPAGTASADSYQWVGPVAGFWNAKANWDDVTAGQDPATAAPGANDLVTIGGGGERRGASRHRQRQRLFAVARRRDAARRAVQRRRGRILRVELRVRRSLLGERARRFGRRHLQ